MKKKIKIDIEDFIMALENISYHFAFYLDKETGEVLYFVDDEIERDDTDDELIDKIEKEPVRYVYIEPIRSFESYKIMEKFIDDVEEIKIKRKLINAINRKKPFRNFKNALFEFPEIEEKWFKFYSDEMTEIVKEWLECEKIKADLILHSQDQN